LILFPSRPTSVSQILNFRSWPTLRSKCQIAGLLAQKRTYGHCARQIEARVKQFGGPVVSDYTKWGRKRARNWRVKGLIRQRVARGSSALPTRTLDQPPPPVAQLGSFQVDTYKFCRSEKTGIKLIPLRSSGRSTAVKAVDSAALDFAGRGKGSAIRNCFSNVSRSSGAKHPAVVSQTTPYKPGVRHLRQRPGRLILRSRLRSG